MGFKLINIFSSFIFVASVSVRASKECCAACNKTEYFDDTISLECEPPMVLNDTTCINVTECTKPVLSHRKCLEKCPNGYLYFTMYDEFFEGSKKPEKFRYTLDDINNNPCVEKHTVWLLLGVTGIANVVYCIFVWLFLSTRNYSTRNMKRWLAGCMQCSYERDEREVLMNTSYGDGDDNGGCIHV